MSQRSKAHAKHAAYCSCGRIVHGNGAKAQHFYVRGDRFVGKRDGHRLLSREQYDALFPQWWDREDMRARAHGRKV